jgi:signal transduction histidine kinase
LVQIRELAQELGGDVAITSQPGAGTRIEALIPVKEGARDAVPTSARAG